MSRSFNYMLDKYENIYETYPFESRDEHLLWRGSQVHCYELCFEIYNIWRFATTGERWGCIHNDPWTRQKAVDSIRKELPGSVDEIRLMDWSTDREHYNLSRTLFEHCKAKYLQHMRGNTYSSRFKYLLLCGSVVLAEENPIHNEWWYEFLPKDAIVPLKDQFYTDAASKLDEVMKSKDKGEAIARRGYDFAMKTFS